MVEIVKILDGTHQLVDDESPEFNAAVCMGRKNASTVKSTSLPLKNLALRFHLGTQSVMHVKIAFTKLNSYPAFRNKNSD